MDNSTALWRIENNVRHKLYWWGFWTGKDRTFKKDRTFAALFRAVRRAAVVLGPVALQHEPPHPALKDFLRSVEGGTR